MIPRPDDLITTARPRPRNAEPLPLAPRDDGIRLPPAAVVSERSIICAILEFPARAAAQMDQAIAAGITQASFTDLVARNYWSALQAIHAAGGDFRTIQDHLTRRGHWTGDAHDLYAAITNNGPWAAGLAGYIESVLAAQRARESMTTLYAGLQGIANGATPESVAATVMAAMTRITPRMAEPVEPLPPRIPFPVGALPPVVAEYVQAVAAALPCAAETVALPLLATIASAIGNSRRISLKTSWTEPSVIWTATILASGKLKSPAHEKAVQFLTRRQQKLIAKHNLELRRYESELEDYEAEKSRRKKSKTFTSELPPPPEMPTCRRYTTSNCTVEALADLLAENERGILLEADELSGWFASFDRYSNGSGGDLAAYLSMHRAGSMTVDRKTGKRVTHIERAAVSVCGTIQPGTLRRCLTAEYFESGLPARILLAMPDSPPRRWSEAIVEPAVEQAMDQLFDSLIGLQMDAQLDDDGEEYHQPVILPLSSEAKALWVEFYDAHAEEQETLVDDRESSAWSKLEAYAARFALIFTLCRNPDAVDIDGQSMADGIRLTRWFCAEIKRVYAMLSESPKEQKENALVALIRDKFGGRITPRELCQSSRHYQPTEVAEAALEVLIAAGYGQWEITTPDGAGRPKTAFVLAGVSTCLQSTELPKTGQKANNVDVDSVDTRENDIPIPPDDDRPPISRYEADAEAELARQAEIQEADL